MKRGLVIAVGLGVAGLCGCPGDDSEGDSPSPGTLQFSSPAFGAGESAGFATVSVTRQGGTAGAVGVLVLIGGGTASPGVDYPWYIDYVASIQWPDGDASTKTFSLQLFDDSALEGDETVDLTLDFPEGGATIGSTRDSVVTVVDSENPLSGSLQFGSNAFSADESAGSAPLTVTRTGGSVGAVSVQIYVVSGSARLGSDVPQWIDYVAELAWPDGDASDRIFDAPIFDDATPEADETVQFILLYPTGEASLGAPTDTILTILDDD